MTTETSGSAAIAPCLSAHRDAPGGDFARERRAIARVLRPACARPASDRAPDAAHLARELARPALALHLAAKAAPEQRHRRAKAHLLGQDPLGRHRQAARAQARDAAEAEAETGALRRAS